MPEGENLNFIEKRFLVQRLACHDTPTQAARAFKEEFGFEVKRNKVAYYDPTTKFGAALAEDLKAIFHETRKKFLTDLDAIPINHKAVQLRALDRALTLADSRGQIPMVIATIEAAGKLTGTIVEKHQHEHTAPGGVPLTAAIFLTGAPQGAPAPETVVRAPQSGD